MAFPIPGVTCLIDNEVFKSGDWTTSIIWFAGFCDLVVLNYVFWCFWSRINGEFANNRQQVGGLECRIFSVLEITE